MLAEAGFVRATKLLALLDRNLHGNTPHLNHIYKVFIRCEVGADCREIRSRRDWAWIGP